MSCDCKTKVECLKSEIRKLEHELAKTRLQMAGVGLDGAKLALSLSCIRERFHGIKAWTLNDFQPTMCDIMRTDKTEDKWFDAIIHVMNYVVTGDKESL